MRTFLLGKMFQVVKVRLYEMVSMKMDYYNNSKDPGYINNYNKCIAKYERYIVNPNKNIYNP